MKLLFKNMNSNGTFFSCKCEEFFMNKFQGLSVTATFDDTNWKKEKNKS